MAQKGEKNSRGSKLKNLIGAVSFLFVCMTQPVSALAAFVDVATSVGMTDAADGEGVSWADYDNDGDLDVFVANYSGQQAFLYQNNGNGTFTDVASSAGILSGTNGVGVAWGDYDNDGDMDIFVGNYGQAPFLYRNNGNGTFSDVASSAGVGVVANTVGSAFADYDNDGDLDLYVSNSTGVQDFLYRNNGDGTFTDVAAGAGIVDLIGTNGVAWADYDGDGDMDLFAAHDGPNSLYRNNGNGTFTDVAGTVGITDPPTSSQGVAWGDYDADGDFDIYVSNTSGTQDYLYRNNGNGTFTNVATSVGMTDGSWGLAPSWADYDGDGDLDIYVSNQPNQQDFLYRNNGNGTFTEVAVSEGMADGAYGAAIGWADYDADGDLDLLVSNYLGQQDFLYQNNLTGKNWIKVIALTDSDNNAQTADGQPDRLAIGAKVEVDLNGGADFSTGFGAYAMALTGAGDGYDQSGSPAHVMVGTVSTVDVRVTFPDGDIVVVPGVAVNQTITVKDPGAPPAGLFTQVAPAAGMTDAADGNGGAWADYDGDGDLDLYVTNSTSQQDFLYLNNGNGTFTNVATAAGITAATNSVGADWGDYDNDGDLDVFVGNFGQAPFLYRNNGNGTFTDVASAAGVAAVRNTVGAAWADYDTDGDLDLFVANSSLQQDFLYRNNGDGTFTDVATAVGLVDALGSNGVAWADYDNDGDLDLFVSHDGPNSLYRNNGNGTFTDVASAAGMTDPPTSSQGVAWGDYDADGDLDLYVSNTSAARQDFLYRNNGNGTFTNVATSVGMTDDDWTLAPAWADYDGDGDLDLFATNQNALQDFLYRNNGNGTFTQVAAADGMADASYGGGVGWADYDNDGDLDVFAANFIGQQDFLYRNGLTGKNWVKVVALTDVDHGAATADGQPDRIATGARVEVDLNGGADFSPGIGAYVMGLVGSSDGLSQPAAAAHFMVGTVPTVDVRVTFPDGDTVVLAGVSANQTITVLDPQSVTAPTNPGGHPLPVTSPPPGIASHPPATPPGKDPNFVPPGRTNTHKK